MVSLKAFKPYCLTVITKLTKTLFVEMWQKSNFALWILVNTKKKLCTKRNTD